MAFSWDGDKLTSDPWGNRAMVKTKTGGFALAAYTPPAERFGAQTLTVRLFGDKEKARSLAEAHVHRLMADFRRLTSFQNLQQNAQKIVLYDRDMVIGEIHLQTVFGTEMVNVVAHPVKGKQVEEVEPKYSQICPVLKGYAPNPNPTLGPLHGGYFVFLDGYFSENVLFIPKELNTATMSTAKPWEPIDTSQHGYRLRSLSLLNYEQNSRSVAYNRYLLDDWLNPPPHLVDGWPTGAINALCLYDTEANHYTALTNAEVGAYVSAANWTNTIAAFGTDFDGAAWGLDTWCGVYNQVSRNGDFSYRAQFRFQAGGESWVKELAPLWSGPVNFTLNQVAGLVVGDDTMTEYRRGGRLWATGRFNELQGSLATLARIWLVSPSFGGNNDVQWILESELEAMASAETRIDGGDYTVRPTIARHDWCLVTKEV